MVVELTAVDGGLNFEAWIENFTLVLFDMAPLKKYVRSISSIFWTSSPFIHFCTFSRYPVPLSVRTFIDQPPKYLNILLISVSS